MTFHGLGSSCHYKIKHFLLRYKIVTVDSKTVDNMYLLHFCHRNQRAGK